MKIHPTHNELSRAYLWRTFHQRFRCCYPTPLLPLTRPPPLFQSSSCVDNIILKESSRGSEEGKKEGGGRERGREREWGGKAICHRKQRSARGQDHILAEWLLLVVRYCLAELRGAKGPPSFLPSPLTLCPPFLGQKVVLFANGHCMGPSQSRNLSRFELDRI